jgi:hypothetical protein
MTVMRMAIFVVVNSTLCHLYTQTYSTDIGAQTHGRSSVVSFTDQTYLLGHSTKSTDSLPDPTYGTDSGVPHVASPLLRPQLTDIPSWA